MPRTLEGASRTLPGQGVPDRRKFRLSSWPDA
ncbi:uncharacterized protein METZ01_LOCUS10373 [marine metagenome]|uniref:Uncharacterized protein n=1 Tax=marine metagenome TaxID=408172 RepID=A0A381NTA0_9ZZZZ